MVFLNISFPVLDSGTHSHVVQLSALISYLSSVIALLWKREYHTVHNLELTNSVSYFRNWSHFIQALIFAVVRPILLHEGMAQDYY